LTIIVNEQAKTVADACKDIALSIDSHSADPAAGKTGADAAVAWCNLASKNLDASPAIANSRPIRLQEDPSPPTCAGSASAKQTCATACGAVPDCSPYCAASAKARGACTPPTVTVNPRPDPSGQTQAQIDAMRALSKDLPVLSAFNATKV